jgi:hypothetical protein
MPSGRRQILAVLSAVAILAGLLVGNAAANSDVVKLDARLTGAQELPPADPDGRGVAKVALDVDAGEVCFDVRFWDSGTPNRGHIHAGDAATNGPIVVTFFELRENPQDPRHDELEASRRLDDCVTADSGLLADIVANPQNYYVNIHNARFPAGSMRCQLET